MVLGFSHLPLRLCCPSLQLRDLNLAMVKYQPLKELSCPGAEGRLTLQLSGRPCGGLVARPLLDGHGGVGAGFAGASPSKTRDHARATIVQGP